MTSDAGESPPRAHAVVIDDELDDTRADVVIAKALGLSVRAARKLFEDRAVTRAGRVIAKGDRVRAGDVLDVTGPSPWLLPREQEWLVVVHESADVVVVDKPAGVPSHPLQRGEGGTVADALAFSYPECARASDDEREGGLVHRLDTFTSGLLAAARSREAWQALRRAFSPTETVTEASGDVQRGYLALVEGALTEPLVLDAPIAHDPSNARRMIAVGDEEPRVRGQPKEARTRVTPVSSSERGSLVVVRAEGGRRHQVRVHLASAGYPLVGDELYGGSASAARGGHLLHAAALALPGGPRLISDPPPDFVAAARTLSVEERDLRRGMRELLAL